MSNSSTTALVHVPRPVYYRIEDYLESAGVDEFDNPLGLPRVNVRICKFEVEKVTPKGVWLNRGFMGRRFVLNSARKRYACPTLQEALESFQARKRKQISIYRERFKRAEYALDLAVRMVEGKSALTV